MTLPFALAASFSLGGCFLFPQNDDTPTASFNPEKPLHPVGTPIGPIASNAAEAWPDRPAQPPVLTPVEILQGCSAWAACESSGPVGLEQTQDCIVEIEQMGERAIPLSFGAIDGVVGDERAEFFVRCAIQHAGECAALAGCFTNRTASYECQEDGCDGLIAYTRSCSGTIATMTRENGQQDHRDCARAFGTCDPSSETGCNDRPFTQCDPSKTKADRCDGDIRLGCDGSGQVSYHDCARLGGTCGDIGGGTGGCVYPTDTMCMNGIDQMSCANGMLDACILGRHASVAAPLLCP